MVAQILRCPPSYRHRLETRGGPPSCCAYPGTLCSTSCQPYFQSAAGADRTAECLREDVSVVGQELIAGIWPRRSGYTRRKVAFRCSGSHPGGPKGNRNAFKHGRYTADATARRREVAALIRAMRALAGTTEEVS
jgi:hypothetical protein